MAVALLAPTDNDFLTAGRREVERWGWPKVLHYYKDIADSIYDQLADADVDSLCDEIRKGKPNWQYCKSILDEHGIVPNDEMLMDIGRELWDLDSESFGMAVGRSYGMWDDTPSIGRDYDYPLSDTFT